jgi:hypothetical protein
LAYAGAAPQVTTSPHVSGPPAPAAPQRPAWTPQSSLAAEPHPALGRRYEPPQPASPGLDGAGSTAGTRSSEVPLQMVNSRLFELDYDVDSVGPSGVGRVVLWGTRDNGRTWTGFGSDHDGRSPMLVAVPEEGVYGFRVGVENGAGLGGEKPQSGDPPEVRIGVDLTEPRARFLSAERGTGDQAGQLIVRWEAQDERLSARPVSLYYSDKVGGPWMKIASGLENTGSYAWPIGRRLPDRVYFRVEVCDEAGNVGSFETSDALSLDPVRPAARIGRVRPILDTAQTPGSRHRRR